MDMYLIAAGVFALLTWASVVAGVGVLILCLSHKL